jgi:hypothetical protein
VVAVEVEQAVLAAIRVAGDAGGDDRLTTACC